MDNSFENTEEKKGKRVPLGVGLNSLIHSLDESDESGKKAFRAAQVLKLFKDCICHIYGDSAFLVLQNINAVYILNERDKGLLKKAQPGAKLIKRLIIYTCDSTVYADLDSRQEMIKLWFNDQNERLDKLELLSSKLNMRKRFPYKNECELMKKNISSQNSISANIQIPEDTEYLDSLIENIKEEKLKAALKSLIHPKN